MFKSAVVGGVLGLMAVAVHAIPVIDQNQPDSSAQMAGFEQLDLAQSFKQAASNINGAGIFLSDGYGVGNVTISLYSNLPNAGGALLASATEFASSGSWVDVFWSDVFITAGETYFLVFTSANLDLVVAGNTRNPYEYGQVYANSGYLAFPGFDYTFRTYANDAAVANTVPEPGSLALLGFGLAGLAALRKRKQA